MTISKEIINQPFWSLGTEETLKILETRQEGLSSDEVMERRKLFGSNVIRERAMLNAPRIFVSQFKNPLILALVFAGFVTAGLGEWIETAVIAAAVLVNTALGFYQEYKAETALSLLKTYLRNRARVYRDGAQRDIESEELVPGDIIRILQGNRVPADARLLFVNNCEVDESVLTGESLPVEKTVGVLGASAAMPERTNMVLSGTLVTEGLAEAAVIATGNDTELGRIASLVAAKERVRTPLERAVARFTLWVGAVLGVLIAAIFLFGLYAGYALLEMFLIAVAVAVSAVPEGLPVALTVILAVGVERLAKRRGIVRRLLAAETLGSTGIILTDKTGTLTQARMELSHLIPYPRPSLAEEEESEERVLLRDALLHVDVIVENEEDSPEQWRIVGGPLETAIVRSAGLRSVSRQDAKRNREVIDRLPFSSGRKFAALVVREQGKYHLSVLGAPEILLSCTDLGQQERAKLEALIHELALAGARIVGIFTKEVARTLRVPPQEELRHLALRGLIGFRDPLRPGVREAIRSIEQAGVRTVIATGDHRGTAEAVARELGLVDGKGAVLTGEDLEHLSKEELMARLGAVTVFARVTPEHKAMLAGLYQEKGEVVALTGDGVNDAPALEAADIGVAVGSGTDVAKGAADLVILDDNFQTLVAAIEEGRVILDNIRKVIVYLLSNSLDGVLLIGGSLLTGLALPLNALQILFVNFFSDSFPAVALAFERGVDGFGVEPRKLDRNLFDRQMRFLILGVCVATSTLLFVFYWGLLRFGFAPESVRTFIFAAFATYTLILSFSIRSLEKRIVSYNPFSNLYLVGSVAIGVALTALAVYLPFFQRIFGTVSLSLPWVAGVVGVGLLNIVAVEISKWLFRKKIISR